MARVLVAKLVGCDGEGAGEEEEAEVDAAGWHEHHERDDDGGGETGVVDNRNARRERKLLRLVGRLSHGGDEDGSACQEEWSSRRSGSRKFVGEGEGEERMPPDDVVWRRPQSKLERSFLSCAVFSNASAYCRAG